MMTIDVLRSTGGGAIFDSADTEPIEESGLLTAMPEFSGFAGLLGTSSPDHVFFWQMQPEPAASRPVHFQGTQDCVSHAFAVGLEDWFLNMSYQWPGQIATEVLYGGSRTLVGNKSMSAKGTCCAWVARFLLTFGYVPRGNYESVDLSNYSYSRADVYGRDGIPNQLMSRLQKAVLPDSRILSLGKLKSGASAWTAVGKYYPVPFATKRGFASKRDSDGICSPTDEWHHSMLVRGRCILRGGRKAFVVQNSIGEYLGDENSVIKLDSGPDITLPGGVFLVDYEVFDDICTSEDAYVLF